MSTFLQSRCKPSTSTGDVADQHINHLTYHSFATSKPPLGEIISNVSSGVDVASCC